MKSPFELTLKEVLKHFKETVVKFFFISITIILQRLTDLFFELISGKVIIPIIFFVLARDIQIQGLEGVFADVMQLGIGGVASAGVLFYKYKKDTKNGG